MLVAIPYLEKEYQISKAGISKSLKYLRKHFYYLPVGMLFVIPFAHYIKDKSWEFSYTYGPPLAVAGFIVLEVIPTLIFHLIHWTRSQHFQILIDSANKTITFRLNKGGSHKFSFDQLTVTEHLSLYQENKKRLSTGWSNYSYLQISTSDNKEFQISSLILTKEQFPIEPIETKYSFWPSINSAYKDHQPEIDRTEQHRKEQLNNWKEKFSNLSSEELKSRLEQPKDYDELPRLRWKNYLKKKATNILHKSGC